MSRIILLQAYYQWVPFVLGLQCIIFYLPHLLWEMVCISRASGDVFTLIEAARKAASGGRSDRKREVHRVAEFLEDMIDAHQCSRRGRKAKLVDKMYDTCGLCVVSKRMGTCLVWSYIALKVVIILNAALQLHLIQIFLGFTGHYIKPVPVDPLLQETMQQSSGKGEHGYSFGWAIASYIRSGQEWPETLLFPRVAYCRVPSIRLVGGENAYTAQCTLPINMLNEKIYIFLWFWILFLLITSLLSLFLWIIRITSPFRRYRYIARFLRVCKIGEEAKRPTGPRSRKTQLENFVDDYLRQDGVFLVRMLAINAGEVLAADVVGLVWNHYQGRKPEDITPLPANFVPSEMMSPHDKIQKIEVGFV
ncbi:unnamed protein product [Hydatigera taeniaeformis]|uniref:Innexin n=1 Tax=Hydatigena taeniaeformis TaxID=6205 RepID=A0A0R3WQP8_HYDTA|nr:unnamed protein product [Hydatigera taeniaeformis]